MIDDGLKPSTIKDYLSRLKTLLDHAIYKYEILVTNPIRDKDYTFAQEKRKKKKINALIKIKQTYLLELKRKGLFYFICLIAFKVWASCR